MTLEQAVDLHQPVQWHGWGLFLSRLARDPRAYVDHWCRECNKQWPCPTRRVADEGPTETPAGGQEGAVGVVGGGEPPMRWPHRTDGVVLDTFCAECNGEFVGCSRCGGMSCGCDREGCVPRSDLKSTDVEPGAANDTPPVPMPTWDRNGPTGRTTGGL